jgi:hypothetical protein
MVRFYADDSSLVHGSLSRNGENDTVYGQTEIQQRIISLNFRDCRAKIQQVDSLETLERGVVVQVSLFLCDLTGLSLIALIVLMCPSGVR